MNASKRIMSKRIRGIPRRGGRALSLLLALAAPVALTAPAASGVPESFRSGGGFVPRPVQWGACPPAEPPLPDPSPRAECATVEVPLDWSEPGGRKVGVFVARQRAADPASRIGVLMTNPGGPGTPGADSALYADDPVEGYEPDLLRRFDLVSFDPRGIGRSRGARCDERLLASVPLRPRDAAGFERMRALNARVAESCLRLTGPLVAHMDGESTARDMDAIRAALGEDRISYLGHSYGTLLGERHARLFPGRLRTVALDSAMDPDRPGAERYLLDGSTALEGALRQLADWCAKETDCALHGRSLTAVTTGLFARADAGTLRVPGPDGPTRTPVDADGVSRFLTGALARWSPEETVRRIAALHTGTGEAHLAEEVHEPAWRLVLCRDQDFRIRDYAQYRALRQRVARAAPLVRHNSQALDMILGCQGWPLPPKPLPPRAPGPLPPALVVNAAHDAATPLPGARRMARAFPGASLHVRDGVGHWLYRGEPPYTERRLIDAHLRGAGG
jgi:pimeloyl-ACP methyl ester carboxylesterase